MTEDDEKIWLETVADIKKINSGIAESRKKFARKKRKEVSVPFVSAQGFSEDLELSDFHNVDASTAKKIKKSKFAIEGKLDLHGYTVDKAYDAVRNFIFEAYNQQKRCVLIVTGKGYKKEDDDIFSSKGILREKVPAWLNAPDVRPLILSINNPQEKLGGAGSLYVILRRHRS